MTTSNAFDGGSELFTTSDKVTYDMGNEKVYVYKVVEDGNVSIDISYSRVSEELTIKKEGNNILVSSWKQNVLYEPDDLKSVGKIADDLMYIWDEMVSEWGLDTQLGWDSKELAPILAKFMYALHVGNIK